MDEEIVSRERDAVRRYFSQPGFARFLALLRRKYEASKSGPKGYVRLPHPSEEERSALDGFYGRYTPFRLPGIGHDGSNSDDTALKYAIGLFEKQLLASRFGLTLAELFETLDGESVLTRGQLLTEEERAWREMVRESLDLLGQAPPAHVWDVRLAEWIRGLEEGASLGIRILRKLFATRREAAADCLRACIRALAAVVERQTDRGTTGAADGGTSLRLPVLSARVTGDAHAFDWKYPQGRLFWWGLVSVFRDSEGGVSPLATDAMREEADSDADEDMDVDAGEAADSGRMAPARNLSRALLIREGYRQAGIADDDLSSQVMFFAPGWKGLWEEQVLTLRQVERLCAEKLPGLRASAVYVVENPSVFAVLVDEATHCSSNLTEPQAMPVLICGNGQLSVAAFKLLELLLEPSPSISETASAQAISTSPLFYAGDLDSAGIEIARSLRQRFPDCFRAWRMDTDVFSRYAERGIPMTDSERMRTAKLSTPWDDRLPAVVAEAGVKLHQELWLDDLISDWRLAWGNRA